MGKNKRIRKKIEGLEKAKEKHLEKIQSYDGKNEYIIPYWEREMGDLDTKKKELKRKLKND